MLVLHVYIMGKNGNIERTYDFLRNDGKDSLEGCDIVIPYDKENPCPISERDAVVLIANQDLKGDH